MNPTPETLQTLSNFLKQTMSPVSKDRNQAEKFLQQHEGQQGFSLLLLNLLGSDSNDPQMQCVKLAAAINFKNFIKRNWKITEDGGDKIHGSDRDAVKNGIVELMLKSPSGIQKQLSAAIAIIGQQDFPAKWPNLINEMVTKFATGDFNIIHGVLITASSIFEKYSIDMKSQKLWEEIKFVLDNFAQPFTDLLNATMNLAKEHAQNPAALKVIFGSLHLIAKIFYFLNYQDLPEFFEDNMQTWMTHFLALLEADNKCLVSDDDDEPGLLEDLKSQICDNIGLYAHKYEEEFSPYMKPFVMSVWNLLLSLGPQKKYDMLTSNAIQFLASVADRAQYKSLFEEESTLASICEKIIVPNIEMRECDVELFEDTPEQYVTQDLEGSDVDTRRRAACDLVKGLSRFFEPQITSIFGGYVKTMLDMYNANPAQAWKKKDAAIYLVTSLATKAKTTKHGITQTNQLVDLTDLCRQHIIPELQKPNVDDLPVLKASAVKYILTFRSQLPTDIIKGCLPFIINHLKAQSHVTHTYAAAAIDKILILKIPGSNNVPTVTANDLSPMASDLLQGLFGAFNMPGSAENEYVMKCIMRTFSCLQGSVIPFLATLLPVLTQKLQQAAKNPTKPHFNHYIFETFCLAIRIVCTSQPGAVSNFEGVLFPVIQEILTEDVQEFVPYVFQILSLLLEYHNPGNITGPYMELFQFLLIPVLWERPGNIKPLVRLIQAYIRIGAAQVVQAGKVEALLGVFQKMLASKSNDHEGFYLLQTMIECMPAEALNQYIKGIFQLLFSRLTSSKTTKFVKSFLVFIFLYTCHHGGQSVQELIDSIQPNMFGMVIDRLVILEVQKVSGIVEKKICAVGLTKWLCETNCVITGAYSQYWPKLLQTLVGFFELPQDDSIPDDEHFIEIEDTPGYQTAYSQLNFLPKNNHDPLANIQDPKINLAQSLAKLSVGQPGLVTPLVAQTEPKVQEFLKVYLQNANVNLN